MSDITRGASYNNVLPSLNLNFEFPNDQFVRVGLAKTLARGRMDDMKAGNSVSISPTDHAWSGSGGNPELKPWLANSADLSYERYFDKHSYVAVAGFYKKLLNYIYNQTSQYDFTGTPNPTALQPQGPIGLYTRPANGTGGNVKGIELSGALDAGTLVSALDGFGLQASASYTTSNLHPDGPDDPSKLPGLSPVVAGLTVYYEKNGFAARIASTYRSDYIGEITDFAGDRALEYVRHELITDFQTSYEFQNGPAKGLMILFQVNNLTNTPFIDYSGNVTQTRDYETFGREIFFGLNYKF